ncbi:MAG: hypothetical protein SGJ04_03020, partial [Bacteroidota bacterium]|nr:hypothetical protein [Bacteroidota bacterium]
MLTQATFTFRFIFTLKNLKRFGPSSLIIFYILFCGLRGAIAQQITTSWEYNEMYKPELVKLNKFNIKGVHNKDSVSFHYDLSGLLSSYRIVNTSDSIIKSGKLLTSCCDITRFDTIANRDGSISVRISTMDKNGRILNTSFVELLKDKVTSVNTLKREFDESSKLLLGIYQFGIDYEQNGYFSECKYDQFNCLNSVEVTNNYNKEVFDLTYFHFNFKNPND